VNLVGTNYLTLADSKGLKQNVPVLPDIPGIVIGEDPHIEGMKRERTYSSVAGAFGGEELGEGDEDGGATEYWFGHLVVNGDFLGRGSRHKIGLIQKLKFVWRFGPTPDPSLIQGGERFVLKINKLIQYFAKA